MENSEYSILVNILSNVIIRSLDKESAAVVAPDETETIDDNSKDSSELERI